MIYNITSDRVVMDWIDISKFEQVTHLSGLTNYDGSYRIRIKCSNRANIMSDVMEQDFNVNSHIPEYNGKLSLYCNYIKLVQRELKFKFNFNKKSVYRLIID